jgi:hypothetical protein
MKTFIASLIILALLITSVFIFSGVISAKISELSRLALALPQSPEEFFSESLLFEKTEKLRTAWAQSMRVFPYIMSYDLLDRAEDAAHSLSAAAESKCAEDFLSARLRFIVAIERISLLFSTSAESIF